MLYAICITLLVFVFLGVTCQPKEEPEQVYDANDFCPEDEPVQLEEQPTEQYTFIELPIVNLVYHAPVVQDEVQPEQSVTLASLGIRELKKLASAHHIKGYSNLRKSELIERLSAIV